VTSYTSTGYAIGLPYPGDTLAFAADNVQVRNMLSRLRLQSSDARLTERRTVLTHGYYHPDGSGTIYGTWTGEVGTWDLTDPQNPEFTPTAGLWDGTWQGLWQPDYSYQVKILGRGTGGPVDGLELAETATRGAGDIDDPAIPIAYTGIVGPAGALNLQVLDDFDDNKVEGWTPWAGANGSVRLLETNQQFSVSGYWPGVVSAAGHNAIAYGWFFRGWRVDPEQTLELRVDLVTLAEHATAAAIELKQDVEHTYLIFFFRDALFVAKWSSPNTIAFLYKKTSIPSTNVILAAALTRSGPNVVVTARVLDRQNPNAVLCEGSVVDTPGRDASLTTAEAQALSGLNVSFNPDVIGTPFTRGDSFLIGCYQYTDGTLPPAEVTYDNLELRMHDIPLLAIDKAVRLLWPASAFPLTVEGAPIVQGPWWPVTQAVFESGGVKQVAVPTSDAMRFFRLK